MIAIRKPVDAPEILQTRGVAKREEHCREYDNGVREFRFDETIYAHPDVKAALIEAQNGKCCFCETYVADDGQIEHFRPKAGMRQAKRGALLRPGYYWLAYDWDNLLLCCASCNQRHKGNLFPLTDETTRVRSHNDNIDNELVAFIQPAKENPSEFFAFNRYTIRGIDRSSRGTITWRNLALNSDRLIGLRRERHEILTALVRTIRRAEGDANCPADIALDLRKSLNEMLSNEAQFLAMARATMAELRFLI